MCVRANSSTACACARVAMNTYLSFFPFLAPTYLSPLRLHMLRNLKSYNPHFQLYIIQEKFKNANVPIKIASRGMSRPLPLMSCLVHAAVSPSGERSHYKSEWEEAGEGKKELFPHD